MITLAAFFMNLSLEVEHLEIPPRVSALLFIFFFSRQMNVRAVVCFVMNYT